ncbi:hypothetical protein FM076_18100 [Streptomyces albus subsp. chlorinus]|uniref:hypothetical protein n=1 Tax=Streptomyces albus TaxID=1888 RepID=UPI00156E4460|nr:hypothetical protein [Streptomyces albus]NSC22970.1 hypothetical protein [Streptomyces albus subsp. chlorinus]
MRWLRFGLYADEDGVELVKDLVRREARGRAVRLVEWREEREVLGGVPVAELYEELGRQWAYEHPGEDPGARQPVELAVGVRCSLKVWRALRKAVLGALCPEGDAPHVCRVPWAAR